MDRASVALCKAPNLQANQQLFHMLRFNLDIHIFGVVFARLINASVLLGFVGVGSKGECSGMTIFLNV